MKQTTLLFSILLSTAACSGDSSSSVGFSVQAVTGGSATQPTELVMTDDGDTAFHVETAVLRLRHVELDLPDGGNCDDFAETLQGATCKKSDSGDKISIEGPFEVDLVSGTATPSFDTVQIPAGTYKRIDFRVEDTAQDSSLAVTAQFDYEGQALTLHLDLDFNEDIRIENTQGITVDAHSDLLAEFVVGNWLGGVDIAACIDDGDITLDGTVVTVDDSSTSGACSDIEKTIKDNMKNSGQLDRND